MKVHQYCGGLDVTIDTNVLIHSTNKADPRQPSSFAVLAWLRDDSDAHWVLDDQGKAAPDPSTSLLFKEYREHLPAQSVPLVLLTAFLMAGRIRFAPRPDNAVRKKLRQHVPRNKSDQAVLGAAYGSDSKFLISNDLADFNPSTRSSVKKAFGVRITTSDEAVA